MKKWILPLPGVLGFGLFLLTGDSQFHFRKTPDELALIYSLAVGAYYLTCTPLIDYFTQGGFYTRAGWVNHTSAEEQGCIVILMRMATLAVIYWMPLKTIL